MTGELDLRFTAPAPIGEAHGTCRAWSVHSWGRYVRAQAEARSPQGELLASRHGDVRGDGARAVGGAARRAPPPPRGFRRARRVSVTPLPFPNAREAFRLRAREVRCTTRRDPHGHERHPERSEPRRRQRRAPAPAAGSATRRPPSWRRSARRPARSSPRCARPTRPRTSASRRPRTRRSSTGGWCRRPQRGEVVRQIGDALRAQQGGARPPGRRSRRARSAPRARARSRR